MKFSVIWFFLLIYMAFSSASYSNESFEKAILDNDYENIMTCKSDELFRIRNFVFFENSEIFEERSIEKFENKIVILYFWSTIYQSLDEELKDLNSLAGYLREQKISDIVILPIYTTFDVNLSTMDKNNADYRSELRRIYGLIKDKYNEYDLRNLTVNVDVDGYFESLKGDGESFDDCDYSNLKNLQGHRGTFPAIFIIDKGGKQIGKYLKSLTETINSPKWNSREMHDYFRSLRGVGS